MARRVTDEITRLLREKDRKLASGADTLRGMLAEVKHQIVDELARIGGDSYTASMLKANLASIERYLQVFAGAGGQEMERLLDVAWQQGDDLVVEALRLGGVGVFFGHLPGPLLRAIKDFSYHKIQGLSGAAFDKIRGELTLGLLGQKTPHQVITAITGSLDSPGVFGSLEDRAEVIAKTEMGRAYSQATQIGMSTAAGRVPELKKQWWHAGHPRMPRQNHLALHGQVRPVEEPFVIGSLAIDFPRSPKAPASEVIRCGCDHVPWHPAWADERGEKIKLPIFNERGEEIARRGERSGLDENLLGKFQIGQLRP